MVLLQYITISERIEKNMSALTNKTNYALAGVRIGLGWILLWAFLDKTFGLTFSTSSEQAWLNGGSPTEGFLQFGTSGPFADWFASMAGLEAVDWLFMLGLGLIGLALILGIGIKVAVATGTLLFLMMWMANLPPQNNPLISDHVIYVIALWAILYSNNEQKLGLGRWWSEQELVKKLPILR